MTQPKTEMHAYGVYLYGTKEGTDALMTELFGPERPAPVGQDRWFSDDVPEDDEGLVKYLAEVVEVVLDDHRDSNAGRLEVLDGLLATLGNLRDALEGRALEEPEWYP